MRLLLIFIDGIGLGSNNPGINPFVRYKPRFFQDVFGGMLSEDLGKILLPSACMVPTDANLEVDGLPQSATGQTTIFTGINASKIMGRHIAGFPGPSLSGIIYEHGIMQNLLNKGYCVTSANMYTPDYMDLVAKRKRRHSVTTLLILGAGLPLRSAEEMLSGKAVYQDITNEMLSAREINNIPEISPQIAAKRLIDLSKHYDFTLFEYFQTDRCGHKQNWSYAEKILQILDEFLSALYLHTPPNTLVMVTSDHGNFEDFGTKAHTRNLVPTLLWGEQCERIAENINSLIDLTPAIISILEGAKGHD
jgi:hypothetical protein